MTNATIKHGELKLRKVTGRKAIAGDYVVFKKYRDGTPQGEPFEVLSDDESYNSHTHRYAINGWGGSAQYDLYEAAPAPKKGDTVKILGVSKYGLNYIGKTGVVDIVNFLNDGHTSVVPTEEGLSVGLYLPENLEVQTEEETMMTRTFEVGDKVRVHAAANGRYGDLFDGAEGVIGDIDSDYTEMYRVECDAAGDYDRFEAKDIELIVDAPVEFKVGDYVEVLDASKGLFGDQRDGARGTIDHMAEQTEGIRVSIDGDFDRYPAEALRKLASEAPVTVTVEPSVIASPASFKEGDKVRMISTNPGHGFGKVKTGDIGTVSYATERLITANFPNQIGWNGVASEFELVEESFEGFKVGDVGTVVSNRGGHSFSTGDQVRIYAIVEYGPNRLRGELLNGAKRGGDYFYGNELEKAPEATAAKVSSKAPSEELTFEEGDLIRITDRDKIDGASDVTNGKTYEIIDVDWEGDISIKDDDDDTLTILRCEFGGIEKVGAEEEAVSVEDFDQFSKGDRVVLVSGGGVTPLWNFDNGTEYTVENTDHQNGAGRRISIKKDDYFMATGFALPSQLKLVASPVKGPKASKFSAGDKAILTSDDDAATCGFRVGDEVTIVELSDGINDYTIVKEGARGYASDRHLTAVEAAPEASGGLTVGDTVQVAHSPGFHLFRFEVGEIATVTGFREDGYVWIQDEAGKREHMQPGQVVKHEAAPAIKLGDFIEIDFDFEDGRFSFIDLTQGKAYEVVPYKYDSSKLSIVDDVGDSRVPHIEQGAYKILDAPAPRKLQVGDIVRITGVTSSCNPTDSIGEITEFSKAGSARVNAGYGVRGNYSAPKALTLVVANENREDKK